MSRLVSIWFDLIFSRREMKSNNNISTNVNIIPKIRGKTKQRVGRMRWDKRRWEEKRWNSEIHKQKIIKSLKWLIHDTSSIMCDKEGDSVCDRTTSSWFNSKHCMHTRVNVWSRPNSSSKKSVCPSFVLPKKPVSKKEKPKQFGQTDRRMQWIACKCLLLVLAAISLITIIETTTTTATIIVSNEDRVLSLKFSAQLSFV